MNYDAYFLSAPLRSNGVRLLLSFCLFFYSPFMLRIHSTDFRKIFRNRVFRCNLNQGCNIKTGLNNTVVSKSEASFDGGAGGPSPQGKIKKEKKKKRKKREKREKKEKRRKKEERNYE